MRISFFTDTFLPNIDGVVTSMLNFKHELEAKGHEVFVFSSGDAHARKANKDQQHVFFYRSINFPPYPQYKIALFPYGSARKVKRLGIDVVHCHALASMGLAAIAAAKYSRKPLIGTFHTLVPLATSYLMKQGLARRIATRAAWKAVKTFYRPFDVVTVPSKVIQELLQYHGLESITLSNGVDTERFRPGLPVSAFKHQLCRGKKMLLTTGRLGLEKNVDIVVKAFSALEDSEAVLVITGDGPARKVCEKLAFDLGLSDRVKFLGFVPSQDLPLYYNAADCFVTASTFETQGLALLEAMSCGALCVGADALAIPEAIDDKRNGFLFQPGEVQELAERMAFVLSLDEAKKRKLSLAARAEAEKHSVEKCTAKLVEVYEKLM